ncbi:MAG: hypothetical protein GX173_06125 [Ruminococcaceae bacterium]|nr:hypothetical protein [Oscillospiraceae bacterium]
MAVADPKRYRSTKTIAYGGMLSALIMLAVSTAAWSPTAKMALFSLTSLGIAIAVIEISLIGGFVVYGATALLCLAWPGYLSAWPYVVFFGIYPLVRALVDRKCLPGPARLIRVIWGSLLAFSAVAVMSHFMLQQNQVLQVTINRLGKAAYPVLILLTVVGVLLYDFTLSLLISFYSRRLRNIR